MRRFAILFIIIVFVAGEFILFTQNAYADNPMRKLGRGIANIATGWIDIPKEIAKQVDDESDITAIFAGPFVGLAKAVWRTSTGVYDTVTFLIPFPRDYETFIEPEFVF